MGKLKGSIRRRGVAPWSGGVFGRCTGLCAAMMCLSLVGCPQDDEESPEVVPVDPTLVVDAEQVHVSAPDSDDVRLVVGLPGAVVGSSVQLIGGQETITAPVTPDGGFVARVTGAASVTLTARTQDGRGEPVAAVVPAGPAGRAVNPALLALVSRATGVEVSALASAAPAEQSIVVATATEQQLVSSDAGGTFSVLLDAAEGDVVSFFVLDPAGVTSSVFTERRVPAADLPVLVSAATDPSEPVVVVAPAGAVAPLSNVVIDGQTITADSTGAFAACVTGHGPGDSVTITATDSAILRTVPADVGLSPVLGLGMGSSVTVGNITIAGPVPAAVGQVIAANCATGRWTATAGQQVGDVALLLTGSGYDAVAVFGVGRQGDIGTAQLLTAGSSAIATTPPQGLDDDRILLSATVDGEVVVAGLADAATGWSTLEVGAGAGTRVVRTDPAGAFGTALALDGAAEVSLRRVVGPLGSSSSNRPAPAASASVHRPLEGLLTVETGPTGLVVEAGTEPGAVVVNLDTPGAVAATLTDGRLTAVLPGALGDRVAIFRAAGLGELANAGTSPFVTRTAAAWDAPMLLSAAAPTGCAVVPFGASGTWTVDAGGPLSAQVGSGGGLVARFTQGAAVVTVNGGSGPSTRLVPPLASLDPESFQVGEAGGRVVVASGSSGAGREWILVAATTAGEVAIIQPPQPAPWSVTTDLPSSAAVDLFAIHRPSGEATGCVRVSDGVVVTEPPVIVSIDPAPLVRGQAFELSGTNFSGAAVRIGGVLQEVSAQLGSISGTVADETPLGVTSLEVTTPAGSADQPVQVVPSPVITEVSPDPLVAAELATITGTGFGTSPDVTITTLPQTVVAATDTSITIRVNPLQGVGFANLRVSNGYAADDLGVTVTCVMPTVEPVDAPLLLGAELTLTGTHLLGATVSVAGVSQTVLDAEADELTVLIAPTTPLGSGNVVVTTGCGAVQVPVVVATSAPSITATLPDPAILGAPLNVQGDHLAGAVVTLGGVTQVLTIDSKKGLTFVVDAQTPWGEQALVVTTPGGSASVMVVVAAPPVITDVTPNPVPAGSSVVVTGSNFTDAVVHLGGIQITLSSASPSELVFDVPGVLGPGEHTLSVVTGGGSAEVIIVVIGQPEVLSVAPDPVSVGQPLVISGTELHGATVTIGGQAQAVDSGSGTSISLTVHDETPLGEQWLEVTTAAGTAGISLEVVLGPVILAVDPEPLVVGGAFTLTGLRLAAPPEDAPDDPLESLVIIGGVLQPLDAISETSLSGTLASGTTLGAATLKVVTPVGSASVAVTIAAPPKITAITPTSAQAGELIEVLGTGLTGGSVTIGGVAAQVVSSDGDGLTVLVPGGLSTGAHPVVVTTSAGTATGSLVLTMSPPTIQGVNPNPAALGDLVTVTGEHLFNVQVTIDGTVMPVEAAEGTVLTFTVAGTAPVGTGLTLRVTTPGGQATWTVAVDAPPIEEPVVESITPNPANPGQVITIAGAGLKGASVTVAGVEQLVLSSAPDVLEFSLGAGTAYGTHPVVVTGLGGTTQTTLVVTTPPPVIESVSPLSVVVGEELTVMGAHLDDFTGVTISEVPQLQFATISSTSLVFTVASTTPAGEGVLRITTEGGVVEQNIEVVPADDVAPDLVQVTPETVYVGETITVFGAHLAGSSFSIAGVPHVPIAGTDSVVTLQVAADVTAGYQMLRAEKEGLGSDALEILILPEAPRADRMVASAAGTGQEVALVGLPGAVAPYALVNITATNAPIVSLTADAAGRFGVVLGAVGLPDGVGDTMSIEQIVDGELSEALEFDLAGLVVGAPKPPHPYLVRVETLDADAGGVRVAGPTPAFGAAGRTIIAVSDGVAASADSAELHAVPVEGMALVGVPDDEPVSLFVVDAEGRASMSLDVLPVPFDPPVLSSAVTMGTMCVAGLEGAASAKLQVSVQDAGGSTLSLMAFDALAGSAHSFSAFAQTFPAQGPGPFSWVGQVGEQLWSIPIPVGGAAPTVDWSVEAGQVTLSVAGVGPETVLVASTDAGEASAAFGDGEQADVALPFESGDELRVWLVPLTGALPSGCAVVVP